MREKYVLISIVVFAILLIAAINVSGASITNKETSKIQTISSFKGRIPFGLTILEEIKAYIIFSNKVVISPDLSGLAEDVPLEDDNNPNSDGPATPIDPIDDSIDLNPDSGGPAEEVPPIDDDGFSGEINSGGPAKPLDPIDDNIDSDGPPEKVPPIILPP